MEYVLVHLNMNLIIFGYRGYGKSEGTPNEQGVILDGLAMAKFVFEDPSVDKYVDKNQVFLFGRSLGGAIAARVAMDMTLPFKGIIIENTFTTLGDLVDVMFPFLKYVRKYLLKSKFETIHIIGKILCGLILGLCILAFIFLLIDSRDFLNGRFSGYHIQNHLLSNYEKCDEN